MVLSLWVPLSCCLVVGLAFLVFRRTLPAQWALHVDGHGTITYGSWWALFLGVMVLSWAAGGLGRFMAQDFVKLQHWFAQQKGMVVLCFAIGFGFLGYLVVAAGPKDVVMNDVDPAVCRIDVVRQVC